jgi:AMMECR1 domain-containing protein
LLLRLGGKSGVFLPKVPVEQDWDRLAYLENLCRKAGLPGGSWKDPGAQLFWYEALVFTAKDIQG